jgi:hypothetical protein
MAGQHIEREARYNQTRLSPVERGQLMLELKARGWPLQKIADHPQIQMTKPGVHYALKRLTGQKRVQVTYDTCDGCWNSVDKKQLNIDGLCSECRGDAPGEKSPSEPW